MIINRYKMLCYNSDIMLQTPWPIVDSVMVDNYALPFYCMSVDRVSDSVVLLEGNVLLLWRYLGVFFQFCNQASRLLY